MGRRTIPRAPDRDSDLRAHRKGGNPRSAGSGRRVATGIAILALTAASLAVPGVLADSLGVLAPPHADSGLDTNSDRLYNYLALDVRISVITGGRFTIRVALNDDLDLAALTDASVSVFLEPGVATTRILLSGPDIYNGGVNGPYYAHITLESGLGAVLSTGTHKTAAYAFSDFQPYAIRIVSPTREATLDNDTDGLINWLRLTLTLDVATEDDYVVLSRLVDAGYSIVLTWRTAVHLGAGRGEVSQLFLGYPLRLANVGGPYLVTTDVYDGHGVLVDFLFYETAVYAASSFETPPVVLDPPHFDRGVDGDGNGLFNFLQIDVRLLVDENATAIVRAALWSGDGVVLLGSVELRPDLVKGSRTLAVSFAGSAIYASGRDGPYQVRLTVQDPEGRLLGEGTHMTQAYNYTQFDRVTISFTPPHRDYGLDADGNGKYEALVLAVNATVEVPGTYRFQADLGAGIADAYAEQPLGVGLQTVILRIPGDKIHDAGIDGPYRTTIHAVNSTTGTILDIELYRTGTYLAADFEAAIAPRILGVVGEDTLDTEPLGDGRINVLRTTVRVTVLEEGRYRLEGSLFAGTALVTSSASTTLLPNGTSDLELSFNGWEISAMGLDGPYRLSLALVDLRGPEAILDARDYSTGPYRAGVFQAAAAAELQGRVVSASTGLPLVGAEVWALNYTNAFSRRTWTDAGGNFSLPLFAATYHLIVDHPDGQAEAFWLSASGPTTGTFHLGLPRVNVVQTDLVWMGWGEVALWVRDEFTLDGPALRARIDWDYGDRDGTVEPTEAAILGTPPFDYAREAVESGSTVGFLHVDGAPFLAQSAPEYEDHLLGPVLREGLPSFQIGRSFFLNSTLPSASSEVHVLLHTMSDTLEWTHRIVLYAPGSHYLASYEATGPVFVLARWLPFIVDPELNPEHPDASLPVDVALALYPRTRYVGGVGVAYVAPTPLPPGGLVARQDGSDVSLEWAPSLNNEDGSKIVNLAGYNVYRSSSSGTGYVRINALPVRTPAFGDAGVTGAAYYSVTAVNTDGVESRFSEEASVGTSSAAVADPEVASTNPGGTDAVLPWILFAPAIPSAVLLLIARIARRRPREPFDLD